MDIHDGGNRKMTVIKYVEGDMWVSGGNSLTLKVLVVTIDAQWEGMGDVGSSSYEPALLPPCPTIKVLS